MTEPGDRSQVGIGNLADVLAPVTPSEFFREYAFKRPLLVKGSSDKFLPLFTWDSLNRILSYSRHDPIRVHLDRVGAADHELVFTREITNVRGERIARIDAERLYQRLREGATLVVDAVNEVDPPVSDLCEELAAELASPRATTVLFASFGHASGFIVHWDDRDVYALQVEGRKTWSVYEPSLVAPLDRGDDQVPGSGQPGPLVWKGTLEKGDLLYVPRGWWHEVTSLDEPSLHLNMGSAPVTAFDFLAWVTKRLEASELLRLDIPRCGTVQELGDYERAAKELIASELASAPMREFVSWMRARASTNTHVSLPAGVEGAKAPPRPNQLVRLTKRTSNVDVHDGTTVLEGDGEQVVISASTAPIVDRLAAGEPVTIAELAAAVPDVPLDEVRAMVATLISQAVVHTAP